MSIQNISASSWKLGRTCVGFLLKFSIEADRCRAHFQWMVFIDLFFVHLIFHRHFNAEALATVSGKSKLESDLEQQFAMQIFIRKELPLLLGLPKWIVNKKHFQT